MVYVRTEDQHADLFTKPLDIKSSISMRRQSSM